MIIIINKEKERFIYFICFIYFTMAMCDFVIKYDPEKDTDEDIAKKILYSVVIKRMKENKPCVIFLGGDSGEGKSWGSLRLQEMLMEIQGQKLSDYVEHMNIFTPLEYPKKIDPLLFDKKLKKANIVCLHEAREVIKAKLWQSFLTQAISDINAMSRSIKRLTVIIISQFIRDITSDMRYTLNYYMTVSRPRGRKPRLKIQVMWKDDRDLESPKLRKRRLAGYLVYPSGKYKRFIPQYFELNRPSKEITDRFEKLDIESKSAIIKNKINKLLQELESEIGGESDKVKAIVDWYMKDLNNLRLIGRRVRGKFKVHESFKNIHNLSQYELNQFQDLMTENLKKKGVIETPDEDESDE
jgi:hypothetical protein